MNEPGTPIGMREFACPQCGGRISIPIDLPPTTGPCPLCSQIVTSPPLVIEDLEDDDLFDSTLKIDRTGLLPPRKAAQLRSTVTPVPTTSNETAAPHPEIHELKSPTKTRLQKKPPPKKFELSYPRTTEHMPLSVDDAGPLGPIQKPVTAPAPEETNRPPYRMVAIVLLILGIGTTIAINLPMPFKAVVAAKPPIITKPEPTPSTSNKSDPAPQVVVEPEPAPQVVVEPDPAPQVVVEPEPVIQVVVEPEPAPPILVKPAHAPSVDIEPAPPVLIKPAHTQLTDDYIHGGWEPEARALLQRYLTATTCKEKSTFILNGATMEDRLNSFYQVDPVNELDTPVDGFVAKPLAEEDYLRGIFRMVFGDSSDPSTDDTASTKIQAFFFLTPDGLKLDWELFAQTKYQTLRRFAESPTGGAKAVFRVFITEIPAKTSADSGSFRFYQVVDPSQITHRIRVRAPLGSQAEKDLSPIHWVGTTAQHSSVRSATIELAWPESGTMSDPIIQRLVCWEFLGLGGKEIQSVPTP